MVSIELLFPGGRYHATPWDHHVNEGVVEWPPSPWRILRALIATWHAKCRDEVPAGTLRGLVEQLAGELPLYRLPPACAAHTRHYMPLFGGKTTMVFDAFLQLPDGASACVTWRGVVLDGAASDALGLLVERLGYLGRAESWVQARLMEDGDGFSANVVPQDEAATMPPESEIVRVLAPSTPETYAQWRAEYVASRAQSPKERKKLEAKIPDDLSTAMEADTARIRRDGWSEPPGSRWVSYVRPMDLLHATPVQRSRPASAAPTFARFAVTSAVPPRLTEALWIAERVRTALMSRSEAAPVFSGRDESGRRLGGHRHAYVLAEANGRHGQITHVTVFAAMGFGAAARRALDTLRKVWGHGGHDLQLVLLGLGRPKDFEGRDLGTGQCALVAAAPVWESRTPFVPTRHPKCFKDGRPKRDESGLWIGSPEHDLRRLLREAGLPEPVGIESLSGTRLGGKPSRWLAFRTERKQGHGSRAGGSGHGFRIVFPQPVSGPIALGYAAHFGLGVFAPEGVY